MNVPEFELHHPAGVFICRRLHEAEFVAGAPEAATSKTDMRTGWVWYRLPSIADAEVVVGIFHRRWPELGSQLDHGFCAQGVIANIQPDRYRFCYRVASIGTYQEDVA